MRIAFSNTVHPANLAKSLHKLLAARGIEASLARCQEAVARMTGHLDWHELAKVSSLEAVPFLPDDFATAAERGARRRRFVAAVRGLGADEDTAAAVVDEWRPTGRRRPPSEAVACDFMASYPPVKKFGIDIDVLTHEAVAANPGLLNLLRRTHHAVAGEPFWPERASWDLLGVVSEAAVGLVRPMRRDILHPLWMPAIAATVARMTTADMLRGEADTIRGLAKAFAEGPQAASRFLVALDRDDFLGFAGMAAEHAGLVVVEAAEAAGLLAKTPRSHRTEFALSFARLSAPKAAKPFDADGFGSAEWSRVSLDEIEMADRDFVAVGDRDDDAFCFRRIDRVDDPDLGRLAVHDKDRREIAEFMVGADRFLIVAAHRTRSGTELLGALGMIRRNDVAARSIYLEFAGPWLATRADSGHVVHLMVGYVSSCLQYGDLHREWPKVVPPGTEVSISMADGPLLGDSKANDELMLALQRSVEVMNDIDHDHNAPVLPRLKTSAQPFPDIRTAGATKSDLAGLEKVVRLRLSAAFFNGGVPLGLVPKGDGCRIVWGAGLLPKRGRKSREAWLGEIESMPLREMLRPIAERHGFDDPAVLIGADRTVFAIESVALQDFLPYEGDDAAVALVPRRKASDPETVAAASRDFWAMFSGPVRGISVLS